MKIRKEMCTVSNRFSKNILKPKMYEIHRNYILCMMNYIRIPNDQLLNMAIFS